MAIFIGAMLAILSIAVIIYPFIQARRQARRAGGRTAPSPVDGAPASQENEEGPDLESIYDAIRTLQLEHQVGNVPLGLYREQLDAYRVQAAQALKRQMETQTRDADWALEQEILVARAGLAQSNGHTARCANCGSGVTAALTHCPECNAELRTDERDIRGSRQP
jgi:hypothetical protein